MLAKYQENQRFIAMSLIKCLNFQNSQLIKQKKTKKTKKQKIRSLKEFGEKPCSSFIPLE